VVRDPIKALGIFAREIPRGKAVGSTEQRGGKEQAILLGKIEKANRDAIAVIRAVPDWAHVEPHNLCGHDDHVDFGYFDNQRHRAAQVR
jgi:hypothetical protein